jgi:two-component system phosphate regulon sensor histidine kinase PhoR
LKNNIKRIQNQLNYLSEYAKKLVNHDTNKEKIDNEIKLNSSNKLTKNDTSRIDLQSVINSISEGLIIYSMDLEVIMINPALAQMLLPANPKGTGRLILNPDDRLFFERCNDIKLMEKIQRALIEEPSIPRSDILELKNPKQVLKRYSSPLYDKENNQIGHIIIYHDITKDTEIEELRKDFISNASHELRTPVTSIKLLLESLLSGAKDEPELRDEFLNDLSNEVDRLHQLVNDLLDIAKLESGKKEIYRTNIELDYFLKEVFSTITPIARSKNINLIIPDTSNLKINADKNKLRQVLVNLLNNAVKFTPSDGIVKLEVKKLEGAYEFRVIDTGIGIPQEDQKHIFDKFYRVNKERSRIIGGSGLGLTIVKEIVSAHGGSIHVESKPGNTIFTFRIPQNI